MTSIPKISSFPIGKVNILGTENHVLKTLWIHSEIPRPMGIFVNRHSKTLWIHCFFERDFRFSQKLVTPAITQGHRLRKSRSENIGYSNRNLMNSH